MVSMTVEDAKALERALGVIQKLRRIDEESDDVTVDEDNVVLLEEQLRTLFGAVSVMAAKNEDTDDTDSE